MRHNKLPKTCFISFVLLLASLKIFAADTTVVNSPDGNITFRLFQKNKQLFFSVSLLNQPVVAQSPMDFSVNGTSLTKNNTIQRIDHYNRNKSYPVYGAHSTAVNLFNGIRVLLSSGALQSDLDIRVFNDG